MEAAAASIGSCLSGRISFKMMMRVRICWSWVLGGRYGKVAGSSDVAFAVAAVANIEAREEELIIAMRKRAKDPQSGFSIIEILVSLVLVSLILSALPSALRLGNSGLKFARGAEGASQTNAALNFVGGRLAEAIPIFNTRTTGCSRLRSMARNTRSASSLRS